MSGVEQMCGGLVTKTNFFKNFYLLTIQALTNLIITKIPRFSTQMRRFALIIEGRVIFKPPCKK